MLNTSSSYIQSQLSSVWPEWRITGTLGKGTYGDVYEILRDDLGISYKCALKVLTLESYESDPSLEEFVRNVSREIDMMMQLKGAPHIVTIEDYAVLRDKGVRTILIRMELLESVEKLSRKPGGLDKGEVLQLGIDICTALTSCELSNIIHRDIKLSNIFYSKKTGYKLGDFGISRTMDSIHEKISMSSAGTIQYLAPEVYYGYKYDNTVDIYSLGISLYILLNNNLPPFCNEYNLPPEQISMAMIHEANMRRLRGERFGAPANADERLASVICAACDPDSGNRFPSASQFLNALLACRDNRPVSLPGKTQSLNMTSQVLPSAGTEDNPTKMLFAESNPFQQGSYSQPAGSQRTGQDSLAGHSAAGIPGAAPPFSSNDEYTGYSEDEKHPSSKRPVLLCILLALIAASLFCAILLMKRASSSSTGSASQAPAEDPPAADSDEPAETEDGDSSETVSYVVTWTDQEGRILGSTTSAGYDGDSITVKAPEVNGYEPINEEINITLRAGADNSVTFVYTPVETAPEMDIPSYDTLLYNGHTYYAYETAEINSFRQAQEYCESRGGYLAVIDDDAENTALYDYVMHDLGLEDAYFGLTDEKTEGQWEWVDGSPYWYDNWLEGQPDNANDGEDYALFFYKDTPYTWNDGDFGKDHDTGTVVFLIEWNGQ